MQKALELTVDDIQIGKSNQVASPAAIRRFVQELTETNEKISACREALKEVLDSNAELTRIKDDIKALREERQTILDTNTVIVGFVEQLEEAMNDRKDLIRDAKRDGIPKKEIDTAIRMLKKDVDPQVTSDVFANIADLIE